MPRKRDPKRDEAIEIWKRNDGNITNREIAKQLDVPEKTISAWKSRDKWKVVLQKNDCSTTNKKVPKKARSPSDKKQKKSGNPNPNNQFTKRNKAAETHGFFSKYLPEETLEIMDSMNELSPADLIWDQIQIQYAAIIRAQRIMFVTSKAELVKELKKSKYEIIPVEEDDFEKVATEEEYEIQFAWERHATFLNAQSRAMSELRGSIKQFNELAFEDDERRLKLQQMQLTIDKTKAELERVKNPENEDNEQWIASLKAVANKRRQLKGEPNE